MKMRVGITFAAGCLLALGAAGAADVESGDAVVNAMHTRYENAWCDTVTFVVTLCADCDTCVHPGTIVLKN
jgi:hypothetical protein